MYFLRAHPKAPKNLFWDVGGGGGGQPHPTDLS